MCKTPIAYLLHILEECNYILSVVTDDLPMYQFLSDETLKRAVCRSLEIVGEVTKKIPADVKYQWSDIQWKHMAGMRDRLIHDYMGVNYLIVWDVAKNIIPKLQPQIEAVIEKEQSRGVWCCVRYFFKTSYLVCCFISRNSFF